MARGPGTHNGSGSHGDRGSDGGPGGALARGRGRLQGPPAGPQSGASFLLAAGGRVATRAATGLVVAPWGKDRSATGGGGRT